MATKWKAMPKANPIKSRAMKKSVSTERKFNSLIDSFYRTSNQPRTNKWVNALLNKLTPSLDAKKAIKLWADYKEIRRLSTWKGRRAKKK